MGNCFSKDLEVEDFQRPRHREKDVELDNHRHGLVDHFKLMASYIHHKGDDLMIVVMGGAVDSMILKTRIPRHQTQICGETLINNTVPFLQKALDYAAKESFAPLADSWLEMKREDWMTQIVQEYITDKAVEQNIVLFSRPGLTVYAASWKYAFSVKVRKLLLQPGKNIQTDICDATDYLHEIVKANNNQPIPVKSVVHWAERYRQDTSVNFLLGKVNTVYEMRFERPGIVQEVQKQKKPRRRAVDQSTTDWSTGVGELYNYRT